MSRGFIFIAVSALTFSVGRAADATTPIDYTNRNGLFAPKASATSPEKRAPEINATVQDKRVEKPSIDKETSPLAERRAPIEMGETREKQVKPKDSRKPEKIETPTSRFNHRQATVSTGADTVKPPAVAKYQDSLSAASAANMARFPAMDRATGAKINRFVFRKNPEEPGAVTSGAPVRPAAGGSPVGK